MSDFKVIPTVKKLWNWYAVNAWPQKALATKKHASPGCSRRQSSARRRCPQTGLHWQRFETPGHICSRVWKDREGRLKAGLNDLRSCQSSEVTGSGEVEKSSLSSHLSQKLQPEESLPFPCASSSDVQLRRYFERQHLLHDKDPLQWWEEEKSTFSTLFKVAFKYLKV